MTNVSECKKKNGNVVGVNIGSREIVRKVRHDCGHEVTETKQETITIRIRAIEINEHGVFGVYC